MRPPQLGQRVTSTAKERVSYCISRNSVVLAGRGGGALGDFRSGHDVGSVGGVWREHTIISNQVAATGAGMPARGGGTRAASFSSSSWNENSTWVVPSETASQCTLCPGWGASSAGNPPVPSAARSGAGSGRQAPLRGCGVAAGGRRPGAVDGRSGTTAPSRRGRGPPRWLPRAGESRGRRRDIAEKPKSA